MRDEFDSKPLGQEEDDDEEGDGLIILKVIHDENGEELLSTCDSEEELEAAYAAFMEDLLEDEEEKDDEGNVIYHCRERSTVSGSRSFKIGDADRDNVHASYSDGVLTVTVGKTKETEPEKKSIDIE